MIFYDERGRGHKPKTDFHDKGGRGMGQTPLKKMITFVTSPYKKLTKVTRKKDLIRTLILLFQALHTTLYYFTINLCNHSRLILPPFIDLDVAHIFGRLEIALQVIK